VLKQIVGGALILGAGDMLYRCFLRHKLRERMGVVVFDRHRHPVLLPREANDVVIIRREEYAEERGFIKIEVSPN